jgi:membrane protease YdiL (CAAX protease family)
VVVRVVKGSLFFFPLLTVLFWVGTPLGFWAALYLAFLLELLPALALAQLPLVEDEGPLPRVPVYLSSAALILIIGWLALMVGGREFGFEAMGLGSPEWGVVGGWTLGLTLGALLLLWIFLAIRRAAGLQESLLLVELLPKAGKEKGVFVLLSLAAGVGEELAYRGFLVPTLTLLMGWAWGAALLSSALFGLLHAYQGWLGIFRTAALGFAFAGSLIVTGSLWPAILAHAILDVIAGIFLGEVLLKE